MGHNPHIIEFKKVFNEIAYTQSRFAVFSDFVVMSGISIQNSIIKCPVLEQEYLTIVSKYKKDDVIKMSHLLGCVVNGLSYGFCDFLGSVFMELEINSKSLAQIFTPYSLAQAISSFSVDDALGKLSDSDFITLADPAVGGGSLVIAFAETMLQRGFNPQEKLWVQCTDIDRVAAMMAYVQLSLLGIPAEVIHGNSLSCEVFRSYKTPFHYLGMWDIKLRKQKRRTSDSNGDESFFVATDMDQPDKEIILPADPLPKVVVQRSSKNQMPQLSLFDFG